MQVQKLLLRAGLRPTEPRINVLGLLHAHPHEHFSAEQVYRRLLGETSDMSLSTVYRVLGHLVDARLASSVAIGDGSLVYEYENGKRHYHVMCNACGRIDEFADAEIDERLKAAAAKLEFAVGESRLVLLGLCAQCRSRGVRLKTG